MAEDGAQKRDSLRGGIAGSGTSLSFDELLRVHATHQEEAKEYLPLLYGNSVALTALDLRGAGVTDAAAASLSDALRGNTVVARVDLRDNHVSDEGCQALASMLEANKTVRTLMLDGNRAMTDTGVQALLMALELNKTLQSVSVDRCPGLTQAAVVSLSTTVDLNNRPKALKQALMDVKTEAVELVDLSCDTEGSFRDFDRVPQTRIDCWAMCRLAEALAGCASVVVLRVCNQQVGDVGAEAVATMLQHNQRLDTIDLFSNVITNRGVEELAKSIDTNNCVRIINVKANCASDSAVCALEKRLVLNRQPLYLKKYLPKLAANDPEVCILQLDEHASCRHYDDVSVKLLVESLQGNTHLTAIDLSNNAITEVGALFLSEGLRCNGTLRTINLSNNKLGGRGATLLAEALTTNATLMTLCLVNTGIDDAGGEALAAMAAKTSSLTQLDLSDNPGICESGAHFVRALQHTTCLKELALKGTRVSKVTLRALRDCRAVASEPPALRAIVARLHRGEPALTAVNLRGRQDEFALRDTSASVLGGVLQESYVLTDLDLGYNQITKAGVRHLCDGLLVNRYTLRKLSLAGNNGLDYEVAKMFCEVLSHHRAFSSLDLSNNHLLDGGGKVFYEYFTSTCPPTLTELNISNNKMEPQLEQHLLTLVESHKCLPVIKALLIDFIEGRVPPGRLNLNDVQATIDPDIPESAFNSAARALALAIGQSSDYEHISFQGNRLGDKGVEHFVELFKRNKALVSLDLSHNRITDAGVTELIQMVEQRPDIQSIAIDGNKFVSDDAHRRLQYTLRFHNQPQSLKKLLRSIQKNDPSYTVIDCAELSIGSQVTDVQAEYICEALLTNSHIKVIELGHNHITLQGGLRLVETLRSCPQVARVSLRNNILDRSAIAKAFAELLCQPCSKNLTSLDLAYNDLDDSAARYLIDALESNDTLMELTFKGNAVSAKVMEELQRAVSLNRELDVKRVMPGVRSNDPSVTCVDLHDRNTTDGAVYTACIALASNTHVTRLDLSHNKLVTDASALNYLDEVLRSPTVPLQEMSLAHTGITSVGACHLLAMLEHNTTLETLDLSGTDLAPGRRVIEAAEKAFESNTTFLQLLLDGTGLSEREITHISGKNMNGQPMLRLALPRLHACDPTMTSLDLSGTRSHNNTTCYLLADPLLHNTTLTSLDLSLSRSITDTGVLYIAQALRQNRHLRSLSLRSCSVKDEGAVAVAAALTVNQSLTSIDLSYNKIGSLGCEKLIGALQADVYSNSFVTSIDLTTNNDIREDLVTEIGTQLALNCGPPSLKRDILAIRSGAAEVLDYHKTSFSDQYVALLVDALRGNRSVRAIDLSQCMVESDGGELLAELLKTNTTLTSLNLSRNRIGVAASSLVKALHSNCSLTRLDISSNECNVYDEDRLEQLVELNRFPPALKRAVLASLERDPTQVTVWVSGRRADADAAGAADNGGAAPAAAGDSAALSVLTDEGIVILAETLKTDTYAEAIDLSYNALTGTSVQHLCSTLKVNDSIRVLDLSHNNIAGPALKQLADLACVHKSLSDINLSHNQISDDSAALFLDCLQMNYAVKRLCLDGNPAVSDDTVAKARLLQALNHKDKVFCSLFQRIAMGCTDVEHVSLEGWLGMGIYDGHLLHLVVEAVEMNPHVTSLDLSFCDVGDSQVAVLAGLIASAPHLRALKLPNNLIAKNLSPLTNLLAYNTTLTLLDLRDNSIGLSGAKLIADMLRQNEHLAVLDLSGNNLTEQGVKIITEAVKMNENLQQLWAEGTGISAETLQALEFAITISYKSVCAAEGSVSVRVCHTSFSQVVVRKDADATDADANGAACATPTAAACQYPAKTAAPALPSKADMLDNMPPLAEAAAPVQ